MLAESDNSPTAASYHNVSLVTTVVSTVAVFLLSSVIFFTVGALCMRLLQSRPIEEDDGTLGNHMALEDVQSWPVPIYESLHVSTPRNDYDVKENIAYDHIFA